MTPVRETKLEIERFAGGQQWLLGGAAGGLLFLLASIAGIVIDPKPALFSYLVSFTYWCGIVMAALVLLMIFHAVKAKWMVVLRRPLEAIAVSIIVFLVLFIPLATGLKHIYLWVNPPADLSHEAAKLIAHKRPYLNVTAFLVRTGIYLLLWAFISQRLFGFSTKQDQVGGHELTARQRWLGVAGLPFIALGFSFAAFDWMMSLEPTWFSTIFGVYYFGGSFLSILSLLVIVTDRARGKNLFGDLVSPEHIHNLGKLMLAFTCFWAYIGFSQFLLIWIANIPEEIPFYIIRMKGGWGALSIFLIFAHFVFPFALLLSRERKRNRGKLALIAVWILLVHFVDIYWLIFPTFDASAPRFHWTLITSFVGIGLTALAFTLWRIRGHYTVPVKDPYLADSLRYRQP